MKLATDEADVLARTLRWTSAEDGVRAVLLTSSRVTPNAPRDLLSDYDVVLLVRDVDPFVEDEAWLTRFGVPLLRVRDGETDFDLSKRNTMVFYADGTKIDYSIWPAALSERIAARGTLPQEFDGGYRVLLDKDGVTDGWPAPTHRAYVPAKPTAEAFQSLVEEFWFVATYVAKNLWRDEFLPMKTIFDYELKYLIVRRFLEWRIEIDHGWTVQPGFFGRGLQRYLDAATWTAFEGTYVGSDRAENWAALWQTISLFRRLATGIARDLGLTYPQALDDQMMDYLRQIAALDENPRLA